MLELQGESWRDDNNFCNKIQHNGSMVELRRLSWGEKKEGDESEMESS
jgi:hypothetical protein